MLQPDGSYGDDDASAALVCPLQRDVPSAELSQHPSKQQHATALPHVPAVDAPSQNPWDPAPPTTVLPTDNPVPHEPQTLSVSEWSIAELANELGGRGIDSSQSIENHDLVQLVEQALHSNPEQVTSTPNPSPAASTPNPSPAAT